MPADLLGDTCPLGCGSKLAYEGGVEPARRVAGRRWRCEDPIGVGAIEALFSPFEERYRQRFWNRNGFTERPCLQVGDVSRYAALSRLESVIIYIDVLPFQTPNFGPPEARRACHEHRQPDSRIGNLSHDCPDLIERQHGEFDLPLRAMPHGLDRVRGAELVPLCMLEERVHSALDLRLRRRGERSRFSRCLMGSFFLCTGSVFRDLSYRSTATASTSSSGYFPIAG